MKRKSARRGDWTLIVRSRFVATRLDEPGFHGYVALLYFDAVRDPFWVSIGNVRVCIADACHSWLQHFPDDAPYTLTTMFDASGSILQWYADVVTASGVDDQGVPWYDDLYLDVTQTPGGPTELLDVDELEEALSTGRVTRSEYEHAWQVASELQQVMSAGHLPLMERAHAHRKMLVPALT